MRSMITSINQINFDHKLKTFFLKNHNQWQTHQLINFLVWTYLPEVILKNLHQKLRKLLDFRVFQYYLHKLLSHQQSTRIDYLPAGLLADCGSIISKLLCHIINLLIRSVKFPSSPKASKVTPIFKPVSC